MNSPASIVKSNTAIIALATLTLGLASCGKNDGTQPAPASAVDTTKNIERSAAMIAAEEKHKALKPNRDAFINHLKTAEPKIKSAAWLDEQRNSVMVGIIPDKLARHDGYAESICIIASTEYKLYGGIVRVMDVVSAARDQWQEIGYATCGTEEQNKDGPQIIDFTKKHPQR